jgi:hypothetical protein
MHQPTESRKYQLFPALEKLSMTAGRKSPDPETVLSMAMGQTGSAGEKERTLPTGNALRKPKEQTLVRRRKVSVPELGPMTTVQEIAMDSRMSWSFIQNSFNTHRTDKACSHNTRETTTA